MRQKNHNKISNQSGQNGTFGEHLVMFQLGIYKNMSIAHVDYVGADLIAINLDNPDEKIAISVKTRRIGKTESLSCSLFTDNDEKHLSAFSNDMKMQPMVAYVLSVQNEANSDETVHTFIFTLDDLCRMKDDISIKYVNQFIKTKDNKKIYGTRFSFGPEHIEEILSNPEISHIQMDINAKINCWGDNRNHVNIGENLAIEAELQKDSWEKQFGNFGEFLTTWIFGPIKGWRTYHIDHIGADIIAFDKHDISIKYALSVKSKTKKTSFDGRSKNMKKKLPPVFRYNFTKKDIDNLMEFSNTWNMVPMVTFIFFEINPPELNETNKLHVFSMTLDYMEKSSKALEPITIPNFRYSAENSITFSCNESDLRQVKDNENIEYFMLTFNENTNLWDAAYE